MKAHVGSQLDSPAMLAYLEGEPGRSRVEGLLMAAQGGKGSLYRSLINWERSCTWWSVNAALSWRIEPWRRLTSCPYRSYRFRAQRYLRRRTSRIITRYQMRTPLQWSRRVTTIVFSPQEIRGLVQWRTRVSQPWNGCQPDEMLATAAAVFASILEIGRKRESLVRILVRGGTQPVTAAVSR